MDITVDACQLLSLFAPKYAFFTYVSSRASAGYLGKQLSYCCYYYLGWQPSAFLVSIGMIVSWGDNVILATKFTSRLWVIRSVFSVIAYITLVEFGHFPESKCQT